jgi:hypothetical protein
MILVELSGVLALQGKSEEAIELVERGLPLSINEKQKSTTRAILCFLYLKSGKPYYKRLFGQFMADTFSAFLNCNKKGYPRVSFFGGVFLRLPKLAIKMDAYNASIFGGERGIRTLAGVAPTNDLANRPLRPLGYFSKNVCRALVDC